MSGTNADELKKAIIADFPGLDTDPDFTISGKPDINYNCIAWAAFRTNVWWWPIPIDKRPFVQLDGVVIDWPHDLPCEYNIENLVSLFEKEGYKECTDGKYQEGFRKVALYFNESTGEMTHGARQLTSGKQCGLWTSKLGDSEQIIHGTAEALEGKIYGKVAKFMIKEIPKIGKATTSKKRQKGKRKK